VFGDDPTVNALESKIAEMTAKEAALLLPSGTQSNLVALLTHCQRGDEYIVGQDYHSYKYEAGGGAVLGSLQPQPIQVEADGCLDLELVKSRIKPLDHHFARSKLLVLENTHNGKVLPLSYMAEAYDFAKANGLSLHLDGARAFNAAVSMAVDIAEITRHADTVSICCSKGLGAPMGSLLCGSLPFIAEARRWRKMVGGGMRQAGIIAAAIDYALEHNIERLAVDHRNAQRLAAALEQIDGVNILAVDTNMVFLKLPNHTLGEQLASRLAQQGVIIIAGDRLRLVTHLDVSEKDVELVVSLFQQACAAVIAR
jgi:threonine aldolase